MAEITKIEPLSGKNYQSWKYNIKLVLMERGLWGFVEGTENAPNSTATDAVRNAYRLCSDKAYSLIALSVDKSLQVHVSSTIDPRAAWEMLQKQFECVSIAQIVRLNRKFYAATMKEGTDLMEHLMYMTSLAEQLRELKEEITPQKFATVVLGSLPESYDNFISSLNATKVDELNWDDIKGLLIEEYKKREEKEDKRCNINFGGNEALFSDKGNSTWSRGRNPRRGGRNFGNIGNSRQHNRQGSNQGPKCYKCQQVGHFVKNCPLNRKHGHSSIAEHDCKQQNDDIALNSSMIHRKLDNHWYIDSGATKHMTFEKDLIFDFMKYEQPSKIYLGDNRVIEAYGQGKVRLSCYDESDAVQLTLNKVSYVPDLSKNLLSVSAMTQMGAEVLFNDGKCVISKDGREITIGHLVDNKLYLVNTDEEAQIASATSPSLEQWHCRFGHLNHTYIDQLIKDKLVEGMNCSAGKVNRECEACAQGKMHRIPFPKKSEKKTCQPLELIHSDLCGPMNVDSIGGSKYLLTSTDDYTRYVTVYFIRSKSEVFSKFVEYVSRVENETGLRLRAIRTDNGGEYTSQHFNKFCTDKGIMHQFTDPYTPEQNGVSERLNRTLIESARSMLYHAKMPLKFWAESVNTAVYLHNRSPTSALKDKTPFESWFGKKPNVSNLKVFGSVCFVHTPDHLRKKLDPKCRKAIFVGYPLESKGYKVYEVDAKRFTRCRDVLFHENKFHTFEGVTNSTLFYKDSMIDDTLPDDVKHEPSTATESSEDVPSVGATYEDTFMQQVRSLGPTRQRKTPERYHPEECFISESLTAENEEPQSMKEALDGKNSGKWKEAFDAEYSSLINNETWELVPPPLDANIVGSKWVLKVKRDANGNINQYKARLVAQGYSQEKGVDYDEVFSPVARNKSVRSLLALANAHDLEIHQMDVKTAFLNGSLDCEIYMSQPEGFVDPDRPNHVCKLKKSIYGLKQSARCWNTTLDEYLKSVGYHKSNADGCIYVKSVKEANDRISFVILGVYVDDIIPVSNNPVLLKAEKAALCERFEMVDRGEIHYLLGMSIKRDRECRTLTISKTNYVEKVLRKFGMKNCKPISTPLELGRKFQQLSQGDEPFNVQTYQQAIGCLTYMSTATRPDIAAAVGVLFQYMSRPSKDHWIGVKRVLRYLKGTLLYGLKFSAHEEEPELFAYSDADWAGDVDTRRSTSGYVFQIGSSTVSWSSKKQTTVAKSSTEAEYVALSSATQEAVWLRSLMGDLGRQMDAPINVYEDNQGAIELAKNAKYHNRTKHIDICHHFVRERVVSNEIQVIYCPTGDMIADIMTKGLAKLTFEKLRDLLGVHDVM